MINFIAILFYIFAVVLILILILIPINNAAIRLRPTAINERKWDAQPHCCRAADVSLDPPFCDSDDISELGAEMKEHFFDGRYEGTETDELTPPFTTGHNGVPSTGMTES